MRSVNPFTGEVLQEYSKYSDQACLSLIHKAQSAMSEWAEKNSNQKATLMINLAALLESQKLTLASTITQEMGKVHKEAVAEIEKCALLIRYYSEHADQFLKDIPIKTEAHQSFVTFQPLGLVFGIMPWNFPYWQVFRFAIPAMMAGNGCILKHASTVSGCALAIESLFAQAHFPEQLFTTLLIDHAQALELIAHPAISAVTVTGGVNAGRTIAARAGQCLKKTVLELGGSDPYVILQDADLELAAEICVQSKLKNAGQSCIAAKRFIVEEKVYARFCQLFVDKMRQARMGDPMYPNTDLGPLSSYAARDALHQQIQQAIQAGAHCLCGGEIPSLTGAFYPPTVLCDVSADMPIYQQELFGPVAVIYKARDAEQAVTLANDSPFGLGCAIFTTDIDKGQQMAKYEIAAGNCFINTFVRSDPRLPFGGIKQSGYGRELSEFGMKEFVNVKTVMIEY